MRPRIKIALSLVVILALAGVATLTGMTDMNEHRPRLLEILRRVTGHEVRVGQMRLSPARGFTLELEDLELLPRHAGDPPPLECQHAYLGISPAFLFGADLRLSSLTLVKPHLRVVLRKEEPLLQRAREMTRDNSRRLEETLGMGLAEIHVGRVEMRDGRITLIHRAHPDKPALEIENLQGELLGIAPSKPSPFSGVGRIHAIPFTFSGQLGPLPPTLELLEMPFLLRMEAKSPRIGQLMAAIPGLPFKAVADRVDLSTLMNGSLSHGVQTNSWMQFDRLILKHPDTGEPLPPLDAALRQKGEFKLVQGVPRLEIQEMFLYQNGTPILKATGTTRLDATQQVDLAVETLNALELAPILPFLPPLPVVGGSVTGALNLEGAWLGVLRGKSQLDLSKAEMRWSPVLHKQPGVPLNVTAQWTATPQDVRVDAMRVGVSGLDDRFLDVEGYLRPDWDLSLHGQWDAAALGEVIPMARSWPLKGPLEGRFSLRGHQGGAFSSSGSFLVTEARWGDVDMQTLTGAFVLDENALRLPEVRGRLGGGLVEGSLWADLNGDRPFMGAFFVSGLSLSEWKSPTRASRPQLEGTLSGHGRVLGLLRDDFNPARGLALEARVRVEPGRLDGVDPDMLWRPWSEGRPPPEGTGKSLYWERAEARLSLFNRTLMIQDLTMRTGGMTLTGAGERTPEGELTMEMLVRTPWWGERTRTLRLVSPPDDAPRLTIHSP